MIEGMGNKCSCKKKQDWKYNPDSKTDGTVYKLKNKENPINSAIISNCYTTHVSNKTIIELKRVLLQGIYWSFPEIWLYY